MNKDKRAKEVLHWVPEGRKRRGRPRKNWIETAKNDREAWKYHGRWWRSWHWIESSGKDVLPDVQMCTG